MDTCNWVGENSLLNGNLAKKQIYYMFNIICKQITSILIFSLRKPIYHVDIFIMLGCIGPFSALQFCFVKTPTCKRKFKIDM